MLALTALVLLLLSADAERADPLVGCAVHQTRDGVDVECDGGFV